MLTRAVIPNPLGIWRDDGDIILSSMSRILGDAGAQKSCSPSAARGTENRRGTPNRTPRWVLSWQMTYSNR